MTELPTIDPAEVHLFCSENSGVYVAVAAWPRPRALHCWNELLALLPVGAGLTVCHKVGAESVQWPNGSRAFIWTPGTRLAVINAVVLGGRLPPEWAADLAPATVTATVTPATWKSSHLCAAHTLRGHLEQMIADGTSCTHCLGFAEYLLRCHPTETEPQAWDAEHLTALADLVAAGFAGEDRQPYSGPTMDLVLAGHDMSRAPHYPGPGLWCEACPIPTPATACPSCGSTVRLVLGAACARDQYDPDDWHRARPAQDADDPEGRTE